MPTILIWRPKEDDLSEHGSFKTEFGHVTLKTDKYLISFCAENGLIDGDFREILENRFSYMGGVKGSLLLNIDHGYGYDPIEYPIDATITNEDVNSVYEEFLLYNGINPEDVTMQRGEEELYKKRQEYEKLAPEEAENVEEPKLHEKVLPKTEYSLRNVLVSGEEDEPFYHKPQTCVSFTFNLIQTVWLKRHPNRPIPVSNPFDTISDLPLSKFFYRVSWFELEVVQKHLKISDTNTTYTSANWAKKAKMSYFLLIFVIVYVFIPILFIVSYFFPFFRYPTFFFASIYITVENFEMIHFIIILLLTLLSNTYPVTIVACTILGVFIVGEKKR